MSMTNFQFVQEMKACPFTQLEMTRATIGAKRFIVSDRDTGLIIHMKRQGGEDIELCLEINRFPISSKTDSLVDEPFEYGFISSPSFWETDDDCQAVGYSWILRRLLTMWHLINSRGTVYVSFPSTVNKRFDVDTRGKLEKYVVASITQSMDKIGKACRVAVVNHEECMIISVMKLLKINRRLTSSETLIKLDSYDKYLNPRRTRNHSPIRRRRTIIQTEIVRSGSNGYPIQSGGDSDNDEDDDNREIYGYPERNEETLDREITPEPVSQFPTFGRWKKLLRFQ